MMNIRKLAAVDMFLHGTRLILAEFALGIIIPLALAWVTLRDSGPAPSAWETVALLWLVGIAANYVPLLLYALLIARGGTVRAEGEPELARIRRYNVQQLVLLLPLVAVVMAVVQEVGQRG